MDSRTEEWGYDPAFTHMTILSIMINKTFGDVIEFGCGFYSTPLIAYICESLNRKSESYERDPIWFYNVSNHFKNVPKLNHTMNYTDDYEKIDLENRKFGVAFIDQELETRTPIAKKLIDKADFIIIHDAEAEIAFKYNELYPLFKWKRFFKFFRNWTCILSNKEDPEKLLNFSGEIMPEPTSKDLGYDLFSTHTPVLSMMLSNTIGDVLELGCGFYSTPLIAYTCQAQKRKSESFDKNKDWTDSVLKLFNNMPKLIHSLSYIEDYNTIDLDGRKFGFVFIDQEAATRSLMIKKLIDKTDYVVIHDTESPLTYHYDEIYPLFKWRYDFKFFHNWTGILSNKQDPKKLLNIEG